MLCIFIDLLPYDNSAPGVSPVLPKLSSKATKGHSSELSSSSESHKYPLCEIGLCLGLDDLEDCVQAFT